MAHVTTKLLFRNNHIFQRCRMPYGYAHTAHCYGCDLEIEI
jgi:hypothetical protein